MQGQWQHQNDDGEVIVVEVDKHEAGYQGQIYFYPPNLGFGAMAHFSSKTDAPLIRERVAITFHPFGRSDTIPVEDLRERHPEQSWPQSIDLTLKVEPDGTLLVEAFAQIKESEETARVVLPASQSNEASELSADAEIISWDHFKKLIGDLPLDRYIFRGQPVQKRLRTSFHRTARKSLFTYINFDIPRLHRAISTSTSNYFDLEDNNHYAAFLNLLQHHGYPTPLLDWTHSPYVASYFAFRHARPQPAPEDRVRIFMFDAGFWRQRYPQFNTLVYTPPHFSLLQPLALENPRSAPQQSLSAIVTVDDVEGYLQKLGQQASHDFLRVFDLPYAERGSVLKELRFMGITAASLFPGFDGTCEAMRIQHFEDW